MKTNPKNVLLSLLATAFLIPRTVCFQPSKGQPVTHCLTENGIMGIGRALLNPEEYGSYSFNPQTILVILVFTLIVGLIYATPIIASTILLSEKTKIIQKSPFYKWWLLNFILFSLIYYLWAYTHPKLPWH